MNNPYFSYSSLRDEDAFALAPVTELDIRVISAVGLDLYVIGTLLSSCADAWKSLQCCSLEYIKLLDIGDPTEPLHPISAKSVEVRCWKRPEKLPLVQQFRDTVRLSFFGIQIVRVIS